MNPLDSDLPSELLALRASIDNHDAALVHLLAERFKLTRQVGHIKGRHGLPAGDPERETAQVGRLRELAVTANLDPAIAEEFLGLIISHVIRHHEAIGRSDHQCEHEGLYEGFLGCFEKHA